MDALIIQLGIKQGRSLELVRSRGTELTVGRGFDNDVVLTDIHIAPKQVRFYQQDQQWRVEILDDTNPVLVNNQVIASGSVIQSGDNMVLGKTRVKLFSSSHAVADTQKLANYNRFQRFSRSWLMPLVAIVFVFACSVLHSYFGSSTTLKWSGYASEALVEVMLILLWAGLWALAGRLFRHQALFGAQLLATALIAVLYTFSAPLSEYFDYATSSLQTGLMLDMLLGTLLLALLLQLNLSFATNIRRPLLVGALLSIAVTATAESMNFFSSQDNYSFRPDFSSTLKPAFANPGGGESLSRFFDELNNEIDKLEDDGEQ